MTISSIITSPFAFKILDTLSYSNVSAVIIIPSSVVTVPLLSPLNLFPSSVISTSVTLKLNCSFPVNIVGNIVKKEINKKKIFNLFFINFFNNYYIYKAKKK